MGTPEGIKVEGDLSLTLVQIAGDSEESPLCASSTGDADGDGTISNYFGGYDCDDASPDTTVHPGVIYPDDFDDPPVRCPAVTSLSIVEGTTSLAGLQDISSVIGDVYIQNTALTNVDGLATLTTVDGDLVIQNNGALTNVDGLATLTTVDGDLVIQNNALTNIDGLAGLTSVGSVYLQSNWALCQSTVDAFVGMLEALGWSGSSHTGYNADC